MSWKNTSERYGSLSIALHWLMLALLIGVYACIELIDLYPKGSAQREGLKTWHFMLGLSVLALVVVRLAARMSGPTPAVVPTMPVWQLRLATAMHVALYALMIVMPLLGWLILSGEAKTIPFFGLQLPALMGPDKVLARSIEDVHGTLGDVGYFLIGAHALAALAHHYLTHDNTLLRMLPRRR